MHVALIISQSVINSFAAAVMSRVKRVGGGSSVLPASDSVQLSADHAAAVHDKVLHCCSLFASNGIMLCYAVLCCALTAMVYVEEPQTCGVRP